MLYTGQSYSVNSTITGRNLAHAQRKAVARALLGADLHVGRVTLVAATIKQAAGLVGVCPAYVAAAKAIAHDPDARAAVLAGRVPLIVAGWSETLADRYTRASSAERSTLTQTVGVGNLWDELIVPAL